MAPVYAYLPFGALWDAYGCCAGCTDRGEKHQFTEHTAGKAGPGCGFPEGKERSGFSVWVVS